MDNRLFHRYAVQLPAMFHVGQQRYRGRVTNLSVGGAYVEAECAPAIGGHVQIAILDEEGGASFWLDMVVARIQNAPSAGFGGSLVQAVSRRGEQHLCDVLLRHFGIEQPAIRSLQPPRGGEMVQLYRFPRVDPEDEEVRWLQYETGHMISGTRKRRQENPDQNKPAPRVSADSVEFIEDPTGLTTTLHAQSPTTHASKPQAASTQSAKLMRIARKISGIRQRGAASQVQASALPELKGTSVAYAIDGATHQAELLSLEQHNIVLSTTSAVPRLWSVIDVLLPVSVGGQSRRLRLKTRVIHIKRKLPRADLHLEVSSVDEGSTPGVYMRLTEAFSKRET